MIETKKKDKAAVFDVDNTLFFTDRALALAQVKVLGRTLTADDFADLERSLKTKVIEATCVDFMDAAMPNGAMIDRMKARWLEGFKIIVLTARPVSVEQQTKELLRKHGIIYDEIYLNPDSTEMRQTRFKTSKLPEIASGYGYVEVYDDHKKVLDSYLRNRMPYVLYWVSPEGLLRMQ